MARAASVDCGITTHARQVAIHPHHVNAIHAVSGRSHASEQFEHLFAAARHAGACTQQLEHAGDHVWFPAGTDVPHHIKNRNDVQVTYLVFGERSTSDVVFHPKHEVVTVKALGWKWLT